jgi:hypothetical protein
MMVARYYDVYGDKRREYGRQREWSDIYVVVTVRVGSESSEDDGMLG